jgi:CHAT domain-containing protein
MIRVFLFVIFLLFSFNNPLYSLEKAKDINETNNVDILEKSNRFKSLHRSIVLDSTLSNDEILFFLFDSLQEAKKVLTKQELKFVTTDIEPFIFQESTDQKIISLQVDFLGAFTTSKDEYWPFNKPKDEVNKFVDLKVASLIKDPKNSFYRVGQLLMEVRNSLNARRYKVAMDQINIFEIELNKLKINNNYLRERSLVWQIIVDGIKFRIYFDSADLKNASIYADKMDGYVKSVLKNKSRSDDVNYKDLKHAISSLPFYLSYDFTVGKYDRVIETGLLIISSYDIDYNNLEEVRAFAKLHKTLSDAYFAKGDDKSIIKGQEFFDSYLDLYKRAPDIDMANLFQNINESLYSRNKQKFDQYWTYYDTSIYEMDPQNQQIYQEAKKIYLNNTKNYFKSNKSEQDKMLKDLWLNLAFYMETMFYLNLDGHSGIPINVLDSYNYIYTFFVAADEKKYAALYAKKYINTLQDYRKQLKDFSPNDLIFFTEKNSENLKKFSSNFYDISDFDSAFDSMRILKENDFLDFVRRSNDSENFLTQISLSNSEKDYFAKMELIADQIKVLNQSLNKSNSVVLSDSIAKKKKEFLTLQNLYKKNLSKELVSSSVNEKKGYKFSKLNLSNNEAALIFSINSNHVDVQFYENNSKPLIFKAELKDNSFQVNILTIQKSLSRNKSVPDNLINSLSSTLLEMPTNSKGLSLRSFISSRNLKKLKIQTDGYLNLMPLTLIRIGEEDIGSKYVLEKIGLSSKNKEDIKNIAGLDAYGATKGNSEFSSNLPGVKKEIESIMEAGINTKNKRFFIDEKFNKVNFYNSFENNTEFIHLATHFKFASSISDSSKMLLGDGSSLTLDQIRSDIKPISTYLLTLSACNTGESITSGDVTKSYEGLSNVFQLKGAKNIISTLWEIDDQATVEFMTIFYSLLLNNNISPSEALNYTQNIYRSGSLNNLNSVLKLPNDNISHKILANISRYKHPYYWAAFQISSIN